MLCEMHVENFALMEEVRLSFSSGLTIFTGETGAGKSMLVDALSVLLGGRAHSDFIRHGLERALVEGVFEELPQSILEHLEEAGYPAEEGQLFLSREINRNGRNLCRVQGRTVPLSLYRSLAQGLVDIQGQMEHQSLFQPETHKGLLDAFGGASHLQLLEKVNQAARRYQSILNKERQLIRSEAERERREDLLRYQIQEISDIDPKPEEEENLQTEKKRHANAEKIMNLCAELYGSLYEGAGNKSSAYDLLGRCRKTIQDLARIDSQTSPLIESIESIYFMLEDIAAQVRDYREEFDFEPGRLDEIEERLIELQRLRKYGSTVTEILNAKHEMETELYKISHLQEELEALRSEKDQCLALYEKKAAELTQEREKQAHRLQEGLQRELADLGLEKGCFEARITPVAEPKVGGAEEIEFYFSANLGEPPKPLAKVASGGEMSRLMLSLKSLLSQIESVGTFIFDEVDSGVGGRTILKVGDKLARIAEHKQVFCITHAAQVAAFGDQHYGIAKEIINERTRTQVKVLSEEERIHELARMLGGDEAQIALDHAENLWKTIRSSSN